MFTIFFWRGTAGEAEHRRFLCPFIVAFAAAFVKQFATKKK
jgi:hypothetical protein